MITIISYGTGHGPLEQDAHAIFPLAKLFKDPHISPELRQLTGQDDIVRAKVWTQPGALAHLDAVYALTVRLVQIHGDVTVAFPCVGGRHRSVVFTDALADRLETHYAVPMQRIHRDIAKPVILR